MNINRFTQKSMEVINACEKIAYDFGNQEIEQEHLLYSLLHVEDSLILKLLDKMGIDPQGFSHAVENLIEKRPKVSGGQIFIGNHLNRVLIYAEDEAKQMGDEYVSVEHLFLSLMKNQNREIKELFKTWGIDTDV